MRCPLATITWEWIVVPSSRRQYKFKGICRNGVPLHLPNQWLWNTFDGGSPATALNYVYGLLRFYCWMEDNDLRIEDVARRHLYEFRSALNNGFGTRGPSPDPLSSSTRRQTLETVLQYLAWAMGLENDEPFLGSGAKKRYRVTRGLLGGLTRKEVDDVRTNILTRPKKTLPGYLTPTEVQQIRDWIDVQWAKKPEMRIRNRAVVEVLFSTGIRKSELCALEVRGWNAEQRILKVPFHEEEYEQARAGAIRGAALVKTGERTVVLSHDATALLSQYEDMYRPVESLKYMHNRLFCLHGRNRGQRLTAYAVEYLFERMNLPFSEGGVGLDKHLHPHIMRHTHATFLSDRGVEGRAIQTQLGHKSYSSTQVYLHISANRRREGIQEAWASAEPFSSLEWGETE